MSTRARILLPLLCLVLSPTAALAGICDGLVAYWALNQGSGATAAEVAGAVNDQGNLVGGPVWAAGISGTALDFDGVNDRVEVPLSSDLTLTNGVSISAWVNVDAGATGLRWIVSTYFGGGYYLRWNLSAPATLQFFGSGSIQATVAPTPGTWVHVCGTQEPATGRQRLYVNGVQVASSLSCIPAPCAPEPPAVPLTIGSFNGGTSGFDGRIDEVYLHNRTLSAQEVLELAGTPSLGDRLAARWCFDEGTGTTTRDIAGLVGDDGTLTNGPLWGTGVSGSAVDYDGVNDRVAVANSTDLTLTSGVSISAWVNLDPTASGVNAIADSYNGTGGSYLRRDATTGAISFVGRGTLSASVAPAPGAWVHISGTYDAATAMSRIYVDGSQVASGQTCFPAPCTPLAPAVPLAIGSTPTGSAPFDGRIDELLIHGRALSASEVQLLASGPPAPVVPGPTAETIPMPGVDASYDLVGDVDLTPRILPGSGFSSRAVLPTSGQLLIVNTLTDVVESTTPLASASVRGIDPAFSPDGSRMAILTVGHVQFFDVTTTPPTLLATFTNGADPPVTDQDPRFVTLGPTLYCIVPYANSVRVFSVAGAIVTSLYTIPRTTVGIDAVDPVMLGAICSVPNVNSVDFFDVPTGAVIGSPLIMHPAVREVDMVPVPALGRVFWPLDGAIYSFDPATATIDVVMAIPGTSVEGCDMVVDTDAPGIGNLGVFANTGFVHFVDLSGAFVISSVPTPGIVERNFDPLITPWSLIGGTGPTIYWSVVGSTYALDPAVGAPVVTLATPGGLVDGCDLTASNDYTRAVLPHPGLVHVINLQTGTLVGTGDGTILTPGTLRVDVDPIFPTAPLDTTRSSRIFVPYRGGMLVLRRYAGLPTQCVVPTLTTVYALDLATMSVAASYPIGPLAAGVDPVIAQGALSPYDDDPYLGRDRDQDFLCNRAQMESYISTTWALPYWPMRTPWYPAGISRVVYSDWWGRSTMAVLANRTQVAIVDQKDGSLTTTLTLPDTVVGGAAYDRDWRRYRFLLDNGTVSSIDMTPVQPAPPHKFAPTVTTAALPGTVQWPPANDAWGGHDIVLADSGSTVRILNYYPGGGTYVYPLPAPAIYPASIDYKNSTATLVLRNYQRCVFHLYPMSVALAPSVYCDDYNFGGYYWRPISNTVYDEMNHAGMNLAYQPQLNAYCLTAWSQYTGDYLWHTVLPSQPIGDISIENKSKLAKVPLVNGTETIINLTPLAWGGTPVVNYLSVVTTWWRPPVWDYYHRWEINLDPPYQMNVCDINRNLVVASISTPAPIVGSATIDPIHQYLRVRLQGNQSFFVDLFKLGQGIPYFLCTRTDSYFGNLLEDAVFDPLGGMDLALVDNGSAASVVITRTRTGAFVGQVNLPAKPVRPMRFDPYNRTAEIVLGSGQMYLLDLSLVDDSGVNPPVLRPVSLPLPALAGIDLAPPAAPNLAGLVQFASGTDGVIKLRAGAGTVEPHAAVAVVNQSNPSVAPNELRADALGRFIAYTVADSGEIVCVIAADAAGNVSTPTCVTLHPVLVTGVEPAPRQMATGIVLASPNPFSGSVEIRIELASADAARLEVFDAAGRRVRLIGEEHLEPGRYTRVWDGRDQGGRSVRAGTYFVRLTVGGARFARPVVLVR
jgi:concanavalin A-like lectin/glucanase superfamily protein/flagellar hook capping protein FlgD